MVGDPYDFEDHAFYIGDINGYMYIDFMVIFGVFYKDVIKMSYPNPTNESISVTRYESHSAYNTNEYAITLTPYDVLFAAKTEGIWGNEGYIFMR